MKTWQTDKAVTPKTPAGVWKLIGELRDFDQKTYDPVAVMEEAADALEFLLQFVEWKDINDAPKDGTEILTYCDFDGPKCCVVVSFEETKENPKWPWWDWDCKGIHESVPTKFLPLPPPPQQEGQRP